MDRLPIRIVSEYKMPPICCACGEPSGPARFKVYASSWNRRRPFAVYFPLCPACEKAYSTVDNHRRLGCWAGAGLAFLVAVAGIVSPFVIAGAEEWGALAWGLFIGAILLGVLAYLVTPLLLSPQLRAPFRRVQRAVQIKDYRPAGAVGAGTMVLTFTHPPFGEAFRELNEQLVVR